MIDFSNLYNMLKATGESNGWTSMIVSPIVTKLSELSTVSNTIYVGEVSFFVPQLSIGGVTPSRNTGTVTLFDDVNIITNNTTVTDLTPLMFVKFQGALLNNADGFFNGYKVEFTT